MNTFYKWLIKQDYRDDPIGDLAQDVLRDRSLPEKKTKNILLSHILLNSKNDEYVLSAFKEAWEEYKKYRNESL